MTNFTLQDIEKKGDVINRSAENIVQVMKQLKREYPSVEFVVLDSYCMDCE